MKNWHCVLLLCACGGTDVGGDDTIDPPVSASPLERCVLDGGRIKELWSVGNQHGPVTSIVAGPIVVLGAEDGSVKQWTVDGDEPSYGKPFTTAGAPVAAMALSHDAHILAATAQGQIAEWRLADASAARTNTIADAVLAALAVSEEADRVVAGTTAGALFDIVRITGVRTELQSTLWGVSSAQFTHGNHLFTAGHNYLTPQIERRAADAPVEVVDRWNDQRLAGYVRSFALDLHATKLVAGGDGFVARFDPQALATGPLALMSAAEHMAVGTVLLPGGALFATAGSEGTLKLWDAETAALVASLPIAAPIGVATDTDGTRLYTSGADGRLHAFGCTP